jgi:peptidoglycan/LPS O-acetylase OafA/YrhL
MPPQRVAYIDSLRCIAALAVLSQHLLEKAAAESCAGYLNNAPGSFGVVLFFYISGFVVPLSVRRRPPALAFVIRRVFRIYPAYLAALGVAVLIALLVGTPNPFARVGVVGSLLNLLLLQEYFGRPSIIGVTWTLSLEFAWYGLFGVIFYQARNVRVSLLVLAFSIGMVLLTLASLYLNVRVPAGRLGLIGAALAGYLTWQQQQQSAGSQREYALALTAFVCAMGFALYAAFGIFTHPVFSLQRTMVPWAAATALFLVATHRSADRFRNALSLRPLVFLGEISYSIYLLHGGINGAVLRLAGASWALVLTPVLSLVLAWLFHRWIEVPGVQLGKWLEQRWQARVPSLDTASA